ncbi:hypothetical protein QU755_05100 [Pseudomonas wenzhouensis]|nr:hypothetical protein [Pseudomonas wenzhouensis]MDM9650872.1 hypothetical protein [Pseudomonas wenzhouensis]
MHQPLCSLLLCLACAMPVVADNALPLLKLSNADLAQPVSIERSLLLEDPGGQLTAA